MLLWILAGVLTLLCCAALFAASRPSAQAAAAPGHAEATRAFYRTQLEGIEADVAGGRLSEAEAVAAKAELAREFMRLEAEKGGAGPSRRVGRWALVAVLPVVALASIGLYAAIGRADLPGQPLLERQMAAEASEESLRVAVAQIEERLVETPNDVRGWEVLAPVYMQMGRYGEAANAYRRVLGLEPPTADRETNLAEALMMVEGGVATEEALELLRAAMARDPLHVRSRFYLAGELTRIGQFAEAVPLWNALLDISTGDEAWLATARAGLAAAEAGLSADAMMAPQPDATTDVMIRGMVDGLAARLYESGGSGEEWMQLVRSRMVLDGAEMAQADLERGLSALDGEERGDLAALAAEIGLEVRE